MELSALAGNGPLKRQLEQETARRGLSHAYILSGPRGSGRSTLAGLLSAALVCTGGGEVPCLRCSACRKAMGGIHPDILRVGEPGKDLTVAQIRAMRSDAYIRPNEAPRKVYFLPDAQTMNAAAQNAMLKLLEEGPAYAAFLLRTDNAAALLPTVRSRCQVLALSPVSQGEAEAWLAERYPDRPPRELAQAARRCEGLLGRAVDELEGRGSGDREVQEGARELLRRLAAGDELALAEYGVALEKWDRDRLEALLEETGSLLRSALAAGAGAAEEPDPLRAQAARQAAEQLSPRALSRAARQLEELRLACPFHVGAGHLTGWLCASLAGLR